MNPEGVLAVLDDAELAAGRGRHREVPIRQAAQGPVRQAAPADAGLPGHLQPQSKANPAPQTRLTPKPSTLNPKP